MHRSSQWDLTQTSRFPRRVMSSSLKPGFLPKHWEATLLLSLATQTSPWCWLTLIIISRVIKCSGSKNISPSKLLTPSHLWAWWMRTWLKPDKASPSTLFPLYLERITIRKCSNWESLLDSTQLTEVFNQSWRIKMRESCIKRQKLWPQGSAASLLTN